MIIARSGLDAGITSPVPWNGFGIARVAGAFDSALFGSGAIGDEGTKIRNSVWWLGIASGQIIGIMTANVTSRACPVTPANVVQTRFDAGPLDSTACSNINPPALVCNLSSRLLPQ